MSRFTRGRRRSPVLVGTALLALAFGVSVGVAKSGPSQVQTPVYKSSFGRCPVNTSGKVYGTAKVTREKGLFTVSVHLRGAVPGKYIIELGIPDPLSPVGCDLYGPVSIQTFNVNASGDGQGSGSFVGTEKQTFAVGVFGLNTFTAYVSPFVKVGSS